MALELKIENSINVTGLELYIEDVTGAYDSTNIGGWGAPNTERKDVALMGLTEKYHTNEDTSLLIVQDPQIDYDINYTNDYKSKFVFNVEKDGGHKHHLIILNPSDNGNTYLDSTSIAIDDYFFLTTDFLVYQKNDDGTNKEITDYKELIEVTNGNKPDSISVDQFWTPKLSIKQAELYNEYRIARTNCVNEREALDSVVEVNLNLTHASGLFYRGLYMDAENVIDTMFDLFDLNT